MFLAVQLIAEIAEIHLKGRIGDDVVEFLQRLAIPVVGMQHGVALDDVGDGVHQVVQDQVQAQQAGGFLRDVLREDGAALLADGMGQIHQQRAGTGRGVVAGDVFDLAAYIFRHQDGGHDFGHRMGRIVLGVLAAAVLVVVLDQVFEEGGVEIVLLGEDALEAELHQLVDEGPAEVVALGLVGDVFADAVKEHDLGPALGLDREDLVVGDGDVAQGVVEEFGEFRGVLAAEEVGDKMLRLQAWRYRRPSAVAASPGRLSLRALMACSQFSALASLGSIRLASWANLSFKNL